MLCSAINMNAQQPVSGIWDTGKNNTKVEITQANNSYRGKVISSDSNKTKTGNQLIKDIKLVDGVWKGKLYNPNKEKWYDATFSKKNDELHIVVDAGMMSKTVKWKKG